MRKKAFRTLPVFFSAFFCCIIFPFLTQAQEEEFLFFAKEEVVVTVSKVEQRAAESAAVVSVITAEEIRKRGYRSIVDILKDIVGIDIIDNVARVEIGIRGINNKSDYGKHILFLLNGHDMGWKQFSRTRIYAGLINVDDIKRIEIIRGPGSALWGDSAILGIINVITNSAEEINGVEMTLGGGAHNTLFESLVFGKKFDNGLELYFSAAGYMDNTSDGRRFKEYSEILGYDVTAVGQKQKNLTFYGHVSWEGFSLTGYKSRFDVHWPMATWGLTGDDTRLVLDKWFVKLNGRFSLSDRMDMEISGSYDNYKFGPGSQYENYPGYQGRPEMGWFIREMVAEDHFIESELQFTYRHSEQFRFVSGLEFEYLDALRWHYPYQKDGALDTYWINNPPEFKTHNWAVYLHSLVKPYKTLGITAGIRYDYHSIYGGVLSPRLGVVFNPSNKLTLKALYGRAFYGPSIHEMYYVKKNSSYGNPELEPEIINTYELDLEYRWNSFLSTKINFFQNSLADIIAYQITEADEIVGNWAEFEPTKASNQYRNIGRARVRGLEGELKSTPFENFDVSFYLTYRDPRNLDDGSRLENTPRLVWGGTINLLLYDRINLNLNMRYVGDRLSIREKERKNPPFPILYENFNGKTEPYYAANLVLCADDIIFKGLNLTLGVYNLFNKEYYDPGRVEDYPQLKRHILFSAKIKI
jgi:iron complex outermembrane receptor protein